MGDRRDRSGPSRRRRKRGRLLVLAAFLLLLAGGAVFVGKVAVSLVSGEDRAPTTTGEAREITVPPGLTAEDVAGLLEQEGVIRSVTAFLVDIRLADAAGDLKPGTYSFTVGQEHASIIEQLRSGGEVQSKRVTLPEGLSIDQAAERLTADGSIDGDVYESLARTPTDFVLPTPGGSALQPSPSDLEGLLFPDTYLLAASDEADDLITLQLAAFTAHTASLDWARTTGLGLTPYEVIIVASLIEKEVRVPEERRLVASVIYNRLGDDVALGIDATVRFALGKWTGPLTKSDLAVDSPYNTRSNRGLPPGPIASPGLAALEAALDPEQTEYLYYVLEDDEGHHFFTDSYEEFLQAKERSPAQD